MATDPAEGNAILSLGPERIPHRMEFQLALHPGFVMHRRLFPRCPSFPLSRLCHADRFGRVASRALARMFFAYPLMTLKVVAAIHFEAVRLMLKSIRRHPHAPKATYQAPATPPPSARSA